MVARGASKPRDLSSTGTKDDKYEQRTATIVEPYEQLDMPVVSSIGQLLSIKRTVYLNHVWGNNPENALVTVNSNNGDVATFTDDIHVHSDEGNDDIVICKTTAATDGDEPEVTSTGVSDNCVYDADAIEYY
ncbi:hypothetical protein PRNP1_001774 [Phytophthora ramorum]